MPTLRQALRALDRVAIHDAYQTWLKRPSAATSIARAEAKLENVLLEVNFYFESNGILDKQGDRYRRLYSTKVEPVVEKFSPEVIYHLWVTDKNKNSYSSTSLPFPIPFEKASQYLALMVILVSQLKQNDALRYHGQYSVKHSADEVAVWLLENLKHLPPASKFPVYHLASHSMFRPEHAEGLLGTHPYALAAIAENPNLSLEMFHWVLEKANKDDDQNAMHQLARNTAPVITPDACELLWDVWRKNLHFGRIRNSTFAFILAERTNISEELLTKLFREGHVEALPYTRTDVPREVVSILLANPLKDTRQRTMAQPAVAPYLEELLSEAKVPTELIAGAAANPAASPDLLARLAQSKFVTVRTKVAKNPSVPAEVAELLSYDRSRTVRTALLKNVAVPAQLRFFANPAEQVASMLLRGRKTREQFLDWAEETFPELKDMPDQFLIQILPSVTENHVAPFREQARQLVLS